MNDLSQLGGKVRKSASPTTTTPKLHRFTGPSRGRMPWFGKHGKPVEPFIIGIGGGSASGKTSVAARIIKEMGVPWVVLLSMDSFYKPLTPEQIEASHRNEYNFDHPTSFDYESLFNVLDCLKRGVKCNVPIYDFKTHSRLPQTKTVYGANVVIFEGIFALYDRSVRELMDLKLFVDTDADIRLARRLKRDVAERARDIRGVLSQYMKFVKPAFEEYIYPTMKYADIIIPRGLDNTAAIDVIVKHVMRRLSERGLSLRHELANIDCSKGLPQSLIVLESTPELKAIHTIIRDETTNRNDLIFFSERISRLLIERALAELPAEDITVTTPTGHTYKGTKLTTKVCGVSIIRAGSTMENSLRQVVKDIPLGKVLIQTDPSTGEPQLHFCKLPDDITERTVLVTDATIATGAAALMAIRVLLDHNVPEEQIIFMSLITAPQGVIAIHQAFPKVKVVVSEVDQGLTEDYYIEPGCGNFADRYFGTSSD
ncbi:uracil phosphoribosyltransferase-domain-containing protein [Polychytrium aggregatum]|uniref:uracil phosphoribosyltransferase-domain-containing protein n=1 Tax=Polychytrium aggregatum TaxID=110093 RepID=UPI0022FE92CC|nr:uracil phosphoribosyltransferase-domain-containing protein [Polychytrium aggregatum]KAI9206344.1 uracil phosphoribosyltransferase-domain-containing protein [Polychytrium aggregatum]